MDDFEREKKKVLNENKMSNFLTDTLTKVSQNIFAYILWFAIVMQFFYVLPKWYSQIISWIEFQKFKF